MQISPWSILGNFDTSFRHNSSKQLLSKVRHTMNNIYFQEYMKQLKYKSMAGLQRKPGQFWAISCELKIFLNCTIVCQYRYSCIMISSEKPQHNVIEKINFYLNLIFRFPKDKKNDNNNKWSCISCHHKLYLCSIFLHCDSILIIFVSIFIVICV